MYGYEDKLANDSTFITKITIKQYFSTPNL